MEKNNFIESIANDTLSELQTIQFNGEIVVVENEESLEEACNDLLNHKIIGFDTETRPKFSKGKPNKVALLQLSTPNTCYLFRLRCVRFDKFLIEVLGCEDIAKIGADVLNDIRALQRLCNFTPQNFIDLQSIAPEWGIADKSVRKLAAIILNGKVSKAQRLSNWEAITLTEPQKIYAATDAWVCTEMYNKLLSTDKK